MQQQMKLIAFLQAQNCSNYPASWRHPLAAQDWDTPGYYQRIARTLEQGKFHLAFFDDRLAMPDRYNDDFRETVRQGVRAVKMDPSIIATVMGLATEKLGLGLTYSTSYYEPFHVARLFATMDLMLGGRVAWNVVTSLNDSEAANFGMDQHLEHDLRYDRADEFLRVVTGHWNSWEEGSVLRDRASGQFADPDRVHRLEHRGKFFGSRGPFTVPRSAQGQPVLIQAGQSGRGRTFAAEWGDLIFVIYPNLDVARKSYAGMQQEIAAAGRSGICVAPAVYPVVAETRDEAEDRLAVIEGLATPEDALILLSEVLNFDFGSKQPGVPFSDDEMETISGLRAIRDRVTTLSGKSNPTIEDFLRFSNRGSVHELPVFCGSPVDVADRMEEWFTGGACDGFVISATHVPGSYEDFVRLVVPELQRRGLFRKEYEGATLRENLGLPIPDARDRRLRRAS